MTDTAIFKCPGCHPERVDNNEVAYSVVIKDVCGVEHRLCADCAGHAAEAAELLLRLFGGHVEVRDLDLDEVVRKGKP